MSLATAQPAWICIQDNVKNQTRMRIWMRTRIYPLFKRCSHQHGICRRSAVTTASEFTASESDFRRDMCVDRQDLQLHSEASPHPSVPCMHPSTPHPSAPPVRCYMMLLLLWVSMRCCSCPRHAHLQGGDTSLASAQTALSAPSTIHCTPSSCSGPSAASCCSAGGGVGCAACLGRASF